MQKDIRWQQRFSNYKKALQQLGDAVALSDKRELSDLEKQGLIQVFEFTHELAWTTLIDNPLMIHFSFAIILDGQTRRSG